MTDATALVEQNTIPVHANRWAALAVLFLASFMNLIDITIVNVALPAIQNDLGASSTELEWIVAIYVLAFAVGLLPCGRFGDTFGRKRMFLIGLAGFTISSAACGIAPDINTLIVARAIQGISGAMMIPQVLAIVHVIFPPKEKSKVFGLFGTISSLGAVVGPVIGGAIISANLGGLDWRPIFLLNLPLGIAAFIGAVRLVPNLPVMHKITPDWGGVALFSVAILLLVFPLIEGRNLGWPWWCFAAIAMSIPFAWAFVRRQKRRANDDKPQLLPFNLLSNRVFLSGLASLTMFFSGIPGLFLILAIFFQSGFGMTAFESGLATAPFPVGVMIASTATGRFGNRWLQERIALGAVLLALGMIALQIVLRNTGDTVFALHFVLPLLICGLGMGVAIASLFQTVLASVSDTDAGAGSGALQAFQQIGFVVSIAIVSQLFFATLNHSDATSAFVEAAIAASWYPIAIFLLITLRQILTILRTKRTKT